MTNNLTEQYLAFILSNLETTFFEVGSELREKLVSKFGLSSDNARQVIKRATNSGKIRSSEPFTFGRGQYAYLLPSKELHAFEIKQLCETRRPPIYRLLQLLDENDGIASYYEAFKVTASPHEEGTTKVTSLQEIVGLLRRLNIVYTKSDSNNWRFRRNRATIPAT